MIKVTSQTMCLSKTHLQKAWNVADFPDPRREADRFTRSGGQCQQGLLPRIRVSDLGVLPAPIQSDVPHAGEDVEGERPSHGSPAGLARVGDDGLVAASE